MELFYGGGEVPKFRTILSQFNNPAISISYINLMRNDKKLPDYPGAMLLDSGAMSVSKSEIDVADVLEQANEYMSFVKANINYVTLAAEFDAQQLTLPVIKQFRSEFYNTLPEDKFYQYDIPSTV